MEKILILDNGGQYVHRIWRTLRELGQGSEIVPREKIGEKLGEKPDGIILSGGPTSVYEDSSVAKGILELNVPILGICWGHQFIAHSLGGEVRYGDTKGNAAEVPGLGLPPRRSSEAPAGF